MAHVLFRTNTHRTVEEIRASLGRGEETVVVHPRSRTVQERQELRRRLRLHGLSPEHAAMLGWSSSRPTSPKQLEEPAAKAPVATATPEVAVDEPNDVDTITDMPLDVEPDGHLDIEADDEE